jgi:predicted AlkP superfamily phosphohydrolase/phosphomutase
MSNAIHTVYQALDRAVSELVAHAGDNATILIVSDHGSGGAGEHTIHLNRWLAQQGWLRFAAPGPASRVVGSLKRLGLALPVPIQEWAFRGPLRPFVGRLESSARLGGIDWAGTQAFSEEVNTFPSIWLNVRGREPQGIVGPGAEYECLRDEIIAELLDWRNPETGERIIAYVWRREVLYHGQAVEFAPDLVLEPALDREYSYTFLSSDGCPGEPLRKLVAHERLGAKGGSMNGSHRTDGVLLLAGSGVQANARVDNAQITDVAPTLLHLLGIPLPSYFDGRVLGEAIQFSSRIPPSSSPSPKVGEQDPSPSGGDAHGEAKQDWGEGESCAAGTLSSDSSKLSPSPSPYSTEQAELVEERLRGLGYRP